MSSNHDDPTSRTASNRPPDGPAVGANGSDTNRPARLGRRTFVKGLGAAGATAVGLSHDRGFAQDAEAIAPLVGYAIGAAAISAVGGIGV
ncbi:twin-arginine translocation signal domain-containing protein [Halorubrum coriense]|uniref:twin-arginine translocation signal domain-containing protein n=1 Tax=Halorubrum coriense TaxID=64713 RepID=UPI0009B59BB0|nr:twin-arginine translocation signal domain-containing protein [Halorubrum coriense]